MSKELQGWFKALPGKVQREFATDFRGIVDGFADELRQVAPQGESGNTRASVRVTRGKDSLELIVEAGGPQTTKPVRNGTSATYDYANAEEFGNSHQPARPWFYPKYRQRRDALRQEIAQAQANAIAKA